MISLLLLFYLTLNDCFVFKENTYSERYMYPIIIYFNQTVNIVAL